MTALTVVVADTRHAKMFELTGPERVLRPLETLQNEFTARHDADLGADAPGHVMFRTGSRGSGAGSRRTALQPKQTHKQHAVQRFAKQLAERIALAAHNGQRGGVVLVAAPRFLAEMRGHLPKSAQRHVVHELPRDLVDLPIDQLRTRLLDALQHRPNG
jgi:protein required for attachment to host cells